jgi:putative hydrolase of HD superfamily
MALIHDIGELETGDIVTSRGTIIDQQRLKAKESEQKASIKKLFKKTDPSNFSLALFQELIDRKTLESQLLWQLDKLDMALQALEYEKEHKKDLSEFFENAKASISDEFLTELLEETIKRRPKSSR